MKMCQHHWDRLRAAIDARGLSALVAESGQAAASNLASEMDHGSTIDNFDPLMGAHNAIWGNALNVGGLAVMADEEDGSERCPLCFLNRMHQEHCAEEGCSFTYDDWIDRAADDMQKAWVALGKDR